MRRFLLGAVVLMSCNFQYSGPRLGGGSKSPPPAAAPAAGPEPVAKAEPTESAAPSKRGDGPSKSEPSTGGAYHRPVKEETWQTQTIVPDPARPRATSSLDGEYLMWPSGECEAPSIKAKGGDVQTNPVSRLQRNAGFVCPTSCENPATITVKNGIASVELAWQRDDWGDSVDGSHQVTFERTRVQVPLYKLPPSPATKDAARGTYRGTMPARTWNDTDAWTHTSNMFDVAVAIVRTDDETSGHGKAGTVLVNTGKDGKFFVHEEGNKAPNCMAGFMQKGFVFAKQPATDDAGGDDDGGPSTSSADRGARRDEQRAATAKRKCRAQCKQDAGECRKGSSGAKAANACNKAERSCESSC